MRRPSRRAAGADARGTSRHRHSPCSRPSTAARSSAFPAQAWSRRACRSAAIFSRASGEDGFFGHGCGWRLGSRHEQRDACSTEDNAPETWSYPMKNVRNRKILKRAAARTRPVPDLSKVLCGMRGFLEPYLVSVPPCRKWFTQKTARVSWLCIFVQVYAWPMRTITSDFSQSRTGQP